MNFSFKNITKNKYLFCSKCQYENQCNIVDVSCSKCRTFVKELLNYTCNNCNYLYRDILTDNDNQMICITCQKTLIAEEYFNSGHYPCNEQISVDKKCLRNCEHIVTFDYNDGIIYSKLFSRQEILKNKNIQLSKEMDDHFKLKYKIDMNMKSSKLYNDNIHPKTISISNCNIIYEEKHIPCPYNFSGCQVLHMKNGDQIDCEHEINLYYDGYENYPVTLMLKSKDIKILYDKYNITCPIHIIETIKKFYSSPKKELSSFRNFLEKV